MAFAPTAIFHFKLFPLGGLHSANPCGPNVKIGVLRGDERAHVADEIASDGGWKFGRFVGGRKLVAEERITQLFQEAAAIA